ncbi:dUTP diphosphatase [Bacillus carboniphilus]|uniref:dUTP diphosphatase n=1 Tax=Bacillus carboniphilus TaxID=86663 RepID=A0ABP3G3H1_9BACI
MLNLNKLFQMQRDLDQTIEEKNNLLTDDLFERKVFAFIVEMAELANETRCFKFWSQKGPSEKQVLLEEYVDGVHFLLSIGIEKNFDSIEIDWEKVKKGTSSLTTHFLKINEDVLQYRSAPTIETYSQLCYSYFELAHLLNFTLQEVEQAYLKKNEINYQRQESGY